MKNNCRVVSFIVVFLILSMSCGAIIYFNNYFKEVKDEEKIEKIFVNIDDDATKELFLNLYKSNHLEYVSKLESDIDNFNVLSSDIKLDIAFNALKRELNDVYASGIELKYIDDYFKNTFKDIIYFNKESIMCATCKKELFIYDSKNNKYIYNEAHKYHEMYESLNFYTKVVDIKNRNNTYVVTYVNLWTDPFSKALGVDRAYSSYNDAVNKVNAIYKSNDDKNMYTEAENEINNNYDLYKDKMHKYTYTFEKIDDVYKIVSLSFK